MKKKSGITGQNLNLTFRYGKHTQFMYLVMITNRPKK